MLSLKCGSALDTMSSKPAVQPGCVQLAVGTGTGASSYIFVYSHFSEPGLHFNKGVTSMYLSH